MISSTDRIEKRVLLRAPQEKVWRAISEAAEFGRWFGMELDENFASATPVRGRIKPTVVDGEVAKMQAKYVGMPLMLYVERIEPMSVFSFRWHPFAIDRSVDYSNEPMTLVTFTLEAVEDGTVLTVSESGFDAIPIDRRADAFDSNVEGWDVQVHVLEKYLHLS